MPGVLAVKSEIPAGDYMKGILKRVSLGIDTSGLRE
jgi:hypothetical protein